MSSGCSLCFGEMRLFLEVLVEVVGGHFEEVKRYVDPLGNKFCSGEVWWLVDAVVRTGFSLYYST